MGVQHSERLDGQCYRHIQHPSGPQLGPSYSGLDHSCVPMVAHISRTVSVAEGVCPGSVMYVQGSGDRAGSRISIHDWKTYMISCKYIFNYPWWCCWSSSSPGNPITHVPDHLLLPWGNKNSGFSIAASEGARAVPREHKAVPSWSRVPASA